MKCHGLPQTQVTSASHIPTDLTYLKESTK
jgi:hypothetical protein